MSMKFSKLSPDQLRWLPRIAAFRHGGLETLIKAASGLAQVGPKPELARGVNSETWKHLRRALIDLELMQEHKIPGIDTPYLRYSDELFNWLQINVNTDTRLDITRKHQRHMFQFCGQMEKQQIEDTMTTQALVALEMANLLHACHGVIEQGEEWGIEFADRLLPFMDTPGLEQDREKLIAARDDMKNRDDGSAHRLNLSNQAQTLFNEGRPAEAEKRLREMLHTFKPDEYFERASAWARIGACRAEVARLAFIKPTTAIDAFERAWRTLLTLEDAAGPLEMRRAVAMDLARLHDTEAQDEWIVKAVESHAKLPSVTESMAEYSDFIDEVLHVLEDPSLREDMNAQLAEAREAGWNEGADAVAKVLDGTRDLAPLARNLDLDDAVLVKTILDQIPYKGGKKPLYHPA